MTYDEANAFFDREIQKMRKNLAALEDIQAWMNKRKEFGDDKTPYYAVLGADSTVWARAYEKGIKEENGTCMDGF